jgi:hypothetical protein
MAINQNHLFEELNGVKCAIVEKNVPPARVEFLRGILEYNGYTVVVVGSPPPKAAPAAAVGAAGVPVGGVAGAGAEGVGAPAPETYTVGVTDVMFNPVNAIFGRLLKTRDGHVVTRAYWQQKENVSDDEKPYFAGR